MTTARQTVLVTGATGFLGGALARHLRRTGYPLRLLARGGAARPELADLRSSAQIFDGDISDPHAVAEAVTGVRWVFHCAGVATDWAPRATFQTANVVGPQTVAEACRAAGVERLIHVSTTDVYGYPHDDGGTDEAAPLRRAGLPYADSKCAGEEAVAAVAAQGLAVTVARPVSIWGPGSKDFVAQIVAMLQRGEMILVDGGRHHAGLVDVENCAAALVALAACPEAAGVAVNIRDDHACTWRRYCADLAAAVGAPAARWSLPAPLVWGAGLACEAAWSALPLPGKPPVTRHVARVFGRPQGYSIARLQALCPTLSGRTYPQTLQATADWLHSAEGRARVAAALG